MVIKDIQSLKRRFRLVQTQRRSLEETRARLRAQNLGRFIGDVDQLLDLEKKELLAWNEQEKKFLVAWAALLFDLLILAAGGDAELAGRLQKAKQWFFESRQSWAASVPDRRGPFVLYTSRLLASALLLAIPDSVLEQDPHFLDDVPDEVFEGPWHRELEEDHG